MMHFVFSGSGVLFPTHLGAAQYVWQHNIPGFGLKKGKDISFHGCSGGSIVAAVLAAGMSPSDGRLLSKEFLPKNIISWNKRFWQPADCMGLFSLNKMGKILSDYVPKTMGETKHPLRIVAVDANRKRPIYFSSKDTPDMPVVTAVMASAAVPFLFTPVKYQDMLLMDGGVSDNLPVDKLGPDEDVVAFKLTGEATKEIKTRLDYIIATLESTLYSGTGFADYVVRLNPPYGAFDIFGIDEKKVDDMFEIGYNTTKDYFGKWIW